MDTVPDVPLCVLVVEDDDSDFELVEASFDKLGIPHNIERVTTCRAAEAVLNGRHHAVVLDLNLPDSQGMDTFDRIASIPGYRQILVRIGIPVTMVDIAHMLENEFCTIESKSDNAWVSASQLIFRARRTVTKNRRIVELITKSELFSG